jgi:hypothetical protein
MPNKARRDRAPNLTDENIELIVLLLDGWNQDKLTWDLLIAQIQKQFKVRYTRQALDRHARISDAFQARKKLLSAPNRPKTPIDARIAALMAENARLKRENNNLLEQFRRWLYNSSRLSPNLMEEDWRHHRETLRKVLDKELPPANRQAIKESPSIQPKRPSNRAKP